MISQVSAAFFADQDALIRAGRFDTATAQLEDMLAAHPDDDRLLHQRMLLLAQTHQFDAAFAASLAISTAFKQQPHVTFQIVAILQFVTQLDTGPEVEAEICRILAVPGIDCAPINGLVHQFFQLRAGAALLETEPLAAGNRCALIHAVLRHAWLVTPDAETICTALRQQLLFLLHADPSSFMSLSEPAFSLAVQGDRNEYAFHTGTGEAAILQELEERLTRLCANTVPSATDVLPPLLGLLMYRAPRSLPSADALSRVDLRAANPALADFIEADLHEQQRLAEYTRDFCRNALLADATSESVARMYAENPYPRWVASEWNSNPQATPYPEFFSLTRAPGWRTANRNAFQTMLVAGCGTGRHPISHAVTFPWLQITAIDLSAASLAYARLMAERLGVRNIEFLQADILTLGDWERRFDIIESVGVLHHLQDPGAGLRIVRGLLHPDGILRLGLYSRLARKAVAEFRHDHNVTEKTWSPDAIRALRHRFFVDDSFAKYREAMAFQDFFSISGCRDLILHEQESQYTIPALVHLLNDNGLEFLTFSPTDIHRFNLLGGTGDPYDLGAWQEVEEKEPKLFTGMYQFFAQPQEPTGA